MARVLLVVACLLASVRFLGLGRWSLWIDEAYTLADAMHPSDSLNPLGYRLFGWFYGALPSRPDELALRLPAAITGWLCVPLTAWCLAPLVRGRVAAFAAVLMAVHPWHLYWSQNARFYTLTQALALLGLGLLLRGLSGDDTRRGGGLRVLFVSAGLVATAALCATHPSAGMFAGPAILILLLARWRGLWPEGSAVGRPRGLAWWLFLVAGGGGLLAAAPWAWDVWELWSDRQGSGDPLHFVASAGYLVGPLLGLAALGGGLLALRRRWSGVRLLALLLVGGTALAFVISCWVRVSAQYVFVVLPLIAGLAAAAVVPPRGVVGPVRRLCLVALLLPAIGESAVYFGLRHGDRPRWREAYDHVFEHRDWNDLVLGMQAPVAQYYWAPWSDDPRSWDVIVQLDSIRAGVPRDWMRYERTIWFVVNLEQLDDWAETDRRRMLEILTQACTLEASFEVPWTPRDLDVHVFRREATAAL